MADARSRNPADLVKYYTDLILASRAKLEEALAEIAEYAEQLRRVADDAGRKLISRQ
jgi:hypothetical protein